METKNIRLFVISELFNKGELKTNEIVGVSATINPLNILEYAIQTKEDGSQYGYRTVKLTKVNDVDNGEVSKAVQRTRVYGDAKEDQKDIKSEDLLALNNIIRSDRAVRVLANIEFRVDGEKPCVALKDITVE